MTATPASEASSLAPYGVGSARTVPMKVIVCSLSRTGTLSLQAALKTLGIPTYHSADLIVDKPENIERWTEAIVAKYGDGPGKGTTPAALSRDAFDNIIGGHMAVVDLPGSLFAVELAELYPDAKVIILNRDPDIWFRSCRGAWPFRFSSVGFTMIGLLQYWNPRVTALRAYLLKLHGLVWRFEWPDADAEVKARKFFHQYYADCRERIPSKRRIEFSVSDGWGPLCEFLGVDVPKVRQPDTKEIIEIPFPRANDASTYKKFQNGFVAQLVKQGIYSWTGRIAFVAACAQAGYLSYEFWVPAVRFVRTALRG